MALLMQGGRRDGHCWVSLYGIVLAGLLAGKRRAAILGVTAPAYGKLCTALCVLSVPDLVATIPTTNSDKSDVALNLARAAR
jgi:hypothetical protein